MNLPSRTTLPCWALDRRLQSTNDSTPPRRDAKEDKGDAMSALDAKLNPSTGEEMDATGHPAHTPSADRHQRRNRALRREHN